MTIKHSTGALSDEQRENQNQRYKEGNEYDYVIVGTGSAAITSASLLANVGHRVCMVEAHDIPGGYAQSFEMAGFHFCGQIHYVWGCSQGGIVYNFLERIGLEKDITFELLGSDKSGGYDRMDLPDGKQVFIPYGFDKLADNIEAAYPGQGDGARQFLETLAKIRGEMKHIPEHKVSSLYYLKNAFKVPNIIKYQKSTLQDLFDVFKVGKEARLILCGQAGDFMLPPEKLSIFMYSGLFGGYNTGAYYPTKHFRYYVDRLMKSITDHEGCHVYYETKVMKIHLENGEVSGIESEDGKVFKATKGYIWNGDPQAASYMIGRDEFPKDYLKKLDYEYSPSGVMIYLGLKDIDLRDHGFGSFNVWSMDQWDMNETWKEQATGNFENPWIFMSTPTLHTKELGTTPSPDNQIMEVASYVEYEPFREKIDKGGYAAYNGFKMDIASKMLDFVERKYVPNLRDHLALFVTGSPVTNEDYVLAPRGNAYGSNMTPENITMDRLKADTPLKNFWWCNASSGFAGLYGTVMTGAMVYMDLTGDHFHDFETVPSDDEYVRRVNEQICH
ncbi:MAG: NAD(P)/FAD-dependent oxidoreductase [Candidatus Peregrinibacteria bacterium]|nr:NAD(P)/FAD-dependent oxidoreductase [Candidatus Peregrinibacteria bacterium]